MRKKLWMAVLFLAPLGFAARPVMAAPPVGWVKIDLLKDEKAPDNPIEHKDLDTVSAIWFKDLDHGLIGTIEGEGRNGGIIYTAAGPKLTGIAFRGYQQAIDNNQNINFRDFVSTPDGLIAMLDRSDTYVHCDNDFKFTREAPGGEFGVEPQLWMTPTTAGKWFCITGTGVVWNAAEEPGKGVEWKTTWFPEGNPPVPDPVPAGMCPEAPSPNTPKMYPFRYVYVSPDGQNIVYPMHSKVAMCLCKDGGKTWLEKPLPNHPTSADGAGPYGVYFTDKMHGWTFYANDLKDSSAYVYYTTDGGETWTAGKLPDNITAVDSRANFRSIFFAPDNQWGWIVGYRGDNTRPMMLRTSDGGATWTEVSSGKKSIAVVADPPLKLFTGFALDKDHIWVGGGNGGLFYCDTASK